MLILLGNSGVGKTRLVRVLEAGGTIHEIGQENKWAECTRTLLPTLGKVRLSSPKEHCDMVTWDVPGDIASRPLVTFSLRGIKDRLKMMPHVLLMCAAAPDGRTNPNPTHRTNPNPNPTLSTNPTPNPTPGLQPPMPTPAAPKP